MYEGRPVRGLFIALAALAVAMVVDWTIVPWSYPVGSAYAVPLVIAALTLPPLAVTVIAVVALAFNFGSNVIQGAPALSLIATNVSMVALAIVVVALSHQRRAAKERTEELERIRERQRRVIEGVPLPIVVFDDTGAIADANPSARALLGFLGDETPRVPLASLFGSGLPDLAAVGDEWRGELQLVTSADPIPVDVYIGRVELPRMSARLLTLRDLRPERELERHRREWVAILGHELRNPLTPIRGVTELMRRRGAIDEYAADIIVRESDRLNRLVTELIEVSLAEEHALKLRIDELDLVALAARVIAEVRGLGADHHLELAGPAELRGRWDGDRLHQVLMNVLLNAVKHTPAGRSVRVVLAQDHERATISVTDDGPGIPADELAHIFDRYRRSGAGDGLGLGLYVTRAIVEAHGGEITASSPSSGGAQIDVVLPLVVPTAVGVV